MSAVFQITLEQENVEHVERADEVLPCPG